MRIGVPKEIKVHEYRVGLVPAAVRELVEAGHEVLVQTGAAAGIGFSDADYQRVGAKIAATAEEIFAASDMIVKVKEPQPPNARCCARARSLFTYLHLAPDPRQTEALVKSGATCIAYETVTAPRRLAAAADADERSRGPHVDTGRRVLPAEGERRPRHPARRRAGRGARQGRDPWWRRVGHACGRDGRGPGRGRHGRRSLGEATARTLVDLRRDTAHGDTRPRNTSTRW